MNTYCTYGLCDSLPLFGQLDNCMILVLGTDPPFSCHLDALRIDVHQTDFASSPHHPVRALKLVAHFTLLKEKRNSPPFHKKPDFHSRCQARCDSQRALFAACGLYMMHSSPRSVPVAASNGLGLLFRVRGMEQSDNDTDCTQLHGWRRSIRER